MTVLVGIKCKDGIVIGSDSSATFAAGQLHTIEQPTKKIEIIDSKIIIAGTGEIGLGQRFCNQVSVAWHKNSFSAKNAVEFGTQLSVIGLQEFAKTGGMKQGDYGALVAYPADSKIHLCELQAADLRPEQKNDGIWYVSMGSGQLIADPFLGFMRNVFWKDGMPDLNDGVFIATWTLQHAIDVNPGGVNAPIQLAVLKKDKKNPVAYMIDQEEIGEHIENIGGMHGALREYMKVLSGGCEDCSTNVPPTL